MTKSGRPCRIPVMAAKMSTDPLPKATSVTPATFCESFKVLEIKNKAGHRLGKIIRIRINCLLVSIKSLINVDLKVEMKLILNISGLIKSLGNQNARSRSANLDSVVNNVTACLWISKLKVTTLNSVRVVQVAETGLVSREAAKSRDDLSKQGEEYLQVCGCNS